MYFTITFESTGADGLSGISELKTDSVSYLPAKLHVSGIRILQIRTIEDEQVVGLQRIEEIEVDDLPEGEDGNADVAENADVEQNTQMNDDSPSE